MTHIYIAVSS